MSQLVKLEKRFEIALEKLELAFANKNPMKISERPNEKKEIIKEITILNAKKTIKNLKGVYS